MIWSRFIYLYCKRIEAVVQRRSVKKVFLEISRNSQENICARPSFLMKKTLAQVFSCEFCGALNVCRSPDYVSYLEKPVHGFSHLIFVKLFRIVFLLNISSRLLLSLYNMLESELWYLPRLYF